jgi:glycerate 2-kinase
LRNHFQTGFSFSNFQIFKFSPMSANHADAIFRAAVKAVLPSSLISDHVKVQGNILSIEDQRFDLHKTGHIVVIGAGKASAQMASELERILGDHISRGFIVTKYGHGLPLKKIRSLEAAHPVPDENSVLASHELTRCLEGVGKDDLVICLISGGASALLTDLPPDAGLADLQQVSKLLLASGAAIQEINTVRKHLSLIKGGQLLRFTRPATTVSLILSDVIGDPLDAIASGPTVPDTSSFQDAWDILSRYGLENKIAASLRTWLQDGLKGLISDTPKKTDSLFENAFNHLVGTNLIALKAASKAAAGMGYDVTIITDRMTGEAREKSVEFVKQCLAYQGPRPACLLMGGETTVTIQGNGLGGRNQEFALAALCALQDIKNTNKPLPTILSAGTDGSDGPTDATGAYVDEKILQETKALKLDPVHYLNNNDSYHFFQKTGGLVITGPTQTNVMDIVIGLIP